MPRGGVRAGAGRPRGAPNKINADQRAAIAASGETPLDYMLRVMRDPAAPDDRRDRMASTAAPYVHAKLASMEVTGRDGEALLPAASDPRETAKAVLAVLSGAVLAPADPAPSPGAATGAPASGDAAPA